MSWPRRKLWPLVVAAFVGVVGAAKIARADAAACIAASDSEVSLRKAGKLREAMSQLVLCVDPSCPAAVRSDCGLRVTALKAAMPSVVLGATNAAGDDLVDVSVTLDAAPFVGKLDGSEVSLDPGSHVFRFEASGQPVVEKTFVIREGEKGRHVNVRLAGRDLLASPPSPAQATRTWATQKTIALALAGAGVVGLGLGTGFGVAASSDWSAAKKDCNATTCNAATRGRAQSEHDSAVTSGTVSTATFVGGGVALAAGVVLWLTVPKREGSPPASTTSLRIEPTLGSRNAGITACGTFQ